MNRSDNLDLPFIMPAQSQKHVTHNDALLRLDAVVQLTVQSRTIITPPETPTLGQGYIIAQGGTDLWSGHDNDIAVWQDGAWVFYAPQVGWRAWVIDAGRLFVWSGADWTDISNALVTGASDVFGVNTQADDYNRLAIKSDAVLFSHDDVTPGSGDMRHVINKSDMAATASFIFQSDYSGRAEFGLTGDDNVSLKVSADGQNWLNAMVIDSQTGAVSFPNTPHLARPDIVYDYYVDPQTGLDTHNGSADAPWASFAPLRDAINGLSVGGTLSAHIAGEIYTNDHLSLLSLTGKAVLYFAPGAEINWTQATDQSCIQANGAATGHLTVVATA